MKDNPRLFNIPLRGSEEWKLEHNARTSAEHNNKRGKNTINWKMAIPFLSRMVLPPVLHNDVSHLDFWDLPYESVLIKRLLQAA